MDREAMKALLKTMDAADSPTPSPPVAPLPSAAPSPPAPVPPSSDTDGEGGGSVERILDSQGVRASSLGSSLPEAMVQDLGVDPFLPTTTVQKGALAGTMAVDVNQLRNKLTHARLNRRLKQHAADVGTPPSAELYAQWELEELNKARHDVNQYRRSRLQAGPSLAGHPTPWVDTDTDTHAAFRQWVEQGGPTGSKLLDWNPLMKTELGRKVSAPFAAATMGSREEVFLEGAEGVPETVTYNEDDAWGFLDWSGRFSALNMLATTMAASGEENIWQALNPTKWDDYARTWGSPEHIKLIQQGQDVFSLADDLQLDKADPVIGDTISQLLYSAGVVSEEQAQGIDDAAGAFLLSLFDPDVFTLATAGAAKAPSMVQKGAKAVVDVTPGARKLESLPASIMEALRGGDIYGYNVSKLAEKAQVFEEAATAFRTILEANLSPEASRNAVETHLKKMKAVAPQLDIMMQRIGAALTGDNAPITSGTFKAQAYADQVYKGVNKEFETVREAAVEAAEHARKLDEVGKVAAPPSPEAPREGVMATAPGPAPKPAVRIPRAMMEELIALEVETFVEGASEGRKAFVEALRSALKTRGGFMVRLDRKAAEYFREEVDGWKGVWEEARQASDLTRTEKAARTRWAKKVDEISNVLAKKLEGRLDGDAPAVEAPPTPRASKKEKSRARLTAETRAAQLRHMADEMLLADLESQTKALRRMLQAGQVTGKVVADGSEKVYTSAVEAVQEALVEVAAAKTPEQLASAQDLYDKANRSLQTAALGLSEQAGGLALAKLEAMTAQARDAARLSGDTLAKTSGKLLKKSTKADKKTVVKDMKAHAKAVKTVKRRSGRAGAERAYVAGLVRAAETMAKGYRRFSTGVSASDDGAVALAKAAEMEGTLTHMKRYGRGSGVKAAQMVYEFASEVVDPAKWRTGTTNVKLQEISAAALGEMSSAADELGRALIGVKDPADKVEVIKKLVTTTEQVNGSFLNTFDDLATWDQAKPILRALLNTKTRGKTFEALANAWLPGGYRAEAARAGLGRLHDQVANIIMYGQTKAPKGAKAKQKASQLVRQMTFEDFMDLTRKATEQVLQTGPLNPADPVAYGYAAQALSEAAIMNRAAVRTTKLVSDIDPKVLAGVQAVSGGLWREAGENLQDVAKLFDQLGMPMHQRKRVTEALDDLSAGLATLFDEELGYSAVIPRQLMAEFDVRVGRIVKEAAGFSALSSSPSLDHATYVYQGVIRNINASLIYGLLVPKPQMFTNIWIGNMAQIWGTPARGGSARAAAKVGGQFLVYAPLEMASHIPGVGKHIDARRAAMADRLGVPMNRVLPPLTSVFYNPHLARFYDPALAPNSAKVEGTDFTYGEMRRWARDQGVLTSFASSSGLHDTLRRTPQYEAGRSRWEKAFGKVWDYTKVYPELMDGLEQRMRVSLFTDLLTKGYSPDEAGKAVREALYDWNSPLSSLEQRVSQNLLMFWGFTRRALNQSMRIITSTMDEAAEDTALDIFIKSSSGLSYLTELAAARNLPVQAREAYALARFGHTYDLITATKEAMRGKDIEEGEDPELRRVYPWWAARASAVEFVYNQPLSATDRDFDAQFGLETTHKTYSIPSGTTMDMMTFLTDQMSLLTAAAYHEEIDAGDVGAEFVTAIADLALRDSFKPVIDDVVNLWTQDKTTYPTNGKPVKSRYDVAALRGLSHLPFWGELVWQDQKTGGWRTSPGILQTYKAFLPLSMELKRVVEPILNRPSIRDGEARWDETAGTISWLVGQWLGLGKERHHDPRDVLSKDTKAVKQAVTRAAGEAKRYRPPGSAGRGPATEAQAPTFPTPAESGELPRQAMKDLLDSL